MFLYVWGTSPGVTSVIYICNAFSLGMIARADLHRVRFAPCKNPLAGLSVEGYTSAVGHADTAALLGVACNRISVKLEVGDWVYVAQLQGPRLPEGTTVLPEGSEFAWVSVWLAADGETA